MSIRRSLSLTILAVGLTMLATAPAMAQPDKLNTWTGNIGLGYVMPQGTFDDIADEGWMITGGATMRPESWPVGIFFDASWSKHDFSREILDLFQSSDGDAQIAAITSGVMWAPKRDGVGFYLNAGVGGYYVKGKLTEPGVAIGCNPWYWWYCGPVGVDVVTDSDSTTKAGANVGAGITFELESGSQIYLEARYHRINTLEPTEYVPLVVGFRW